MVFRSRFQIMSFPERLIRTRKKGFAKLKAYSHATTPFLASLDFKELTPCSCFPHDIAELFKPFKDGTRTSQSMEAFCYQPGTPCAIQSVCPEVWRLCSTIRGTIPCSFWRCYDPAVYICAGGAAGANTQGKPSLTPRVAEQRVSRG